MLDTKKHMEKAEFGPRGWIYNIPSIFTLWKLIITLFIKRTNFLLQIFKKCNPGRIRSHPKVSIVYFRTNFL